MYDTSTGLHLVGYGAATALGAGAKETVAAASAQMANFRPHPFLLDLQGDAYIVAFAPYIDSQLQGADRISALLNYALSDFIHANPMKMPLHTVLCLPENRVGFGNQDASLLGDRLKEGSPGVRLQRDNQLCYGHASTFAALQRVDNLLRMTDTEFCLLAAADSYIDSDTLNLMELNGQVKQADNAHGFIPGEAAAVALLAHDATLKKYRLNSRGCLLTSAVAKEPVNPNEGVCTGAGLTQALNEVLSKRPETEKIQKTFCDLNGETHRVDEYGFTLARLGQHFHKADDFVTPADCWGDVGAASGLLSLILASANREAQGSRLTLMWSSSMQGLRSAALMI